MPADPFIYWRSFHPWNPGLAEIPGKERWENRSIIHPKDESPPERGFTRGAEQFREGGDEK